jgi:hypothetical protein
MKKFLLLAFGLVSFASSAQISSKFYGEPKELKELQSRTLIVEILEENPKVLKKLDKPKKQKELSDYKLFIKQFNEEFKVYATKYWKLNSKIEFKTETEILALNKAKNKSFAVLRYYNLQDNNSFGLDTKMTVAALVYTRCETSINQPDSKIYLPIRKDLNDKFLLEADYKYALETLQSNINYIVATNKVIDFDKYADKMSDQNCSKLKGKTLLVGNDMMMKGRTQSEAKSNYGGDLKFVSEADLNSAVVNKTKNTAVLYSIPYGIIKSGLVVVQLSNFVFCKVIVDCETGEILWLHMPGGFSYGSNITYYLTEKEFKMMAECKKP